MKTFKILGLLLTYPEGSVLQAGDELLEILREEDILPASSINRIERFLQEQNSRDLMDVQEEYVELFDRGRAHCLHLFEHIHGESRDRGQAMVDLLETYQSKGVFIDNNELPDYLPLFMEYLSYCSFEEASQLLGDAIDVIAVIGKKLAKRDAPYASVFGAIEVLSAVKPDSSKIAQAIAEAPKDPETLQELDEEWKEAEAFSGEPLADCHSCSALNTANKAIDKMMGGV